MDELLPHWFAALMLWWAKPIHFTVGWEWRLSFLQGPYRHRRCWWFLDSDTRERVSGYRNYFRLMWWRIDFEVLW